MSVQLNSINFAFLQKNEPLLFRLACLSESLFRTDPNLPTGFIPPRAPVDQTDALKEQIEELKAALSSSENTQSQQLETLEQSENEIQSLVALAKERDSELTALKEKLEELSALAKKDDAPSDTQLIQAADQAVQQIIISEADTRELIDSALNDVGWEADSRFLKHANNTRPEPGRNIAIAEWPTESGPVDYALFCGEICMGVIEAKREGKDVPGVLKQAERYARDILLDPDLQVADTPFSGAPSKPGSDFEQTFSVPFAFATNGRPHVKQLRTKSGIWHRNLRSENNHAKDLPEWFSPDDLLSKLKHDKAKSALELAEEPFDYANLRYYQEDAIKAIETAISDGQENVLISMATGTGKGGLNSKLHAIVDGQGRSVMMCLTEGQTSDHIGAKILYPAIPEGAAVLIADKGYDSDEYRGP